MGRNKEYRQRLKYQVSSALKKTLENQISVELRQNVGFSLAEAELLSKRLASWLRHQVGFRSPNQILVQGALHRKSFSRGQASKGKMIKVTPFQASDLELELEFGLKVMQLGRLLRIIEEAYLQDSLIGAKQLSFICNITPTSLRSRLREVMDLGVWVPIRGMSREQREQGGLFRSTYLLKTYFFNGRNILEARKLVGYAKTDLAILLSRFSQVIHGQQKHSELKSPEFQQWIDLVKNIPDDILEWLPREGGERTAHDVTWAGLCVELVDQYGLSPVKIRAIRAMLDEIINQAHPNRADGEVTYWAVSCLEPPGKPLEECKLVPVRLTLISPDDQPTIDNKDLNRLDEIKYRRMLRYATEAKVAGAYLTYADLSYLMGIHPEAIRRLVNLNPTVVVPLRGSECDIGRGISHKRKIIELYLQMYTETEIVARTGHSYESIESYLRDFGRVWILHERGFPPAMIRKVTGRSMQLVKTYLELIREYDRPEYAFRFQHIKTFVERADTVPKKGGSFP
ncbi:MAG: DUF1670 domain-containing protein [Limnochordia bacterium]|jgi:hypothetical protein